MLIQVRHLSEYRYSNPVGLGVHKLFLIPQYRPFFRIEHQKIKIDPKPVDHNYRQDLAGNWYQQAWFVGETESLKIETDWIFRLDSFNPFGFILDKGFEDSGWNHEYPHFNYQEVEKFLLPFLDRPEPVKYRDFITPIKSKSSGLVDFLVRLTEKIHQNWGHIIRHEQNIWAASLTYSTKKGSCRDLALMQMDMLKSLGLATRFVSGYAFNPDLEDGHELHAWLEVFLPGSGWVGMDPSLGLFTDHHYIPLAVHADPDATMPIQGAFLGSGKSELHTHVQLKLIRA